MTTNVARESRNSSGSTSISTALTQRGRSLSVSSTKKKPGDDLSLGPIMNVRHLESDEMYVDDVHIDFFYRPRTISFLTLVIGILAYYSLLDDGGDTHSLEENLWTSFKAATGMFLAFSAIALPNGPFTRPHPLPWRILLGVLVIYWMFLIFVLFQDYKTNRQVLAFLSPSLKPDRLSGPLPWSEVNYLDSDLYAQNCETSWDNISSRFDIFIVAHFAGWVGKGLMLRSYVMAWICSIFWEITELFYIDVLPNFEECWWDQWIFDVLLANGFGILIGMYLCRFLEVREFNWSSSWREMTYKERIRRGMLQFTPKTWELMRWDPLENKKRYICVIMIVLINMIVELNCFFLKAIFEVPTTHIFNTYRLLLWGFECLCAVRQVYAYANDDTCQRLGTHAWVGLAAAITESLIVLKFGIFMKEPKAPYDGHAFLWTTCWWILALVLFSTVTFGISRRLERLFQVWNNTGTPRRLKQEQVKSEKRKDQ